MKYTDEEDAEETAPEGPETPLAEHPPHGDLLKVRNPSEAFSRLFFDMLLEIYDIDYGFHEAKEAFVRKFVERGIEANCDELVGRLDLMKDRMVRVMITKRLSNMLGLTAEMDRMIELELSIITAVPPSPAKPPPASRKPTPGDVDA
jgi:hypothetical protein